MSSDIDTFCRTEWTRAGVPEPREPGVVHGVRGVRAVRHAAAHAVVVHHHRRALVAGAPVRHRVRPGPSD